MESKTANAFLQDKLKVMVGKVVYEVADPTITTLARVSELSSKLPEPTGDDLSFTLNNAKDAKIIAKIVAVIVVGEYKKYSIIQKIKRYKVARDAMNMPLDQVAMLLTGLITNAMNVDVFTMLIAFLKGRNLLKPTTPQSGQ